MLIAQLTDTHITRPGELAYGVVDTAACLERVVAAIGRLAPPPDIVVVTGDLVDHGVAEEYEQLRQLLAPLPMPVFVIPGNHDARGPLRAAFGGDGYLPREGFLHYTVEEWPLRLVALDTLVPGEVGGTLCEERLGRAFAKLDETTVADLLRALRALIGASVDATTGTQTNKQRRSA